MKGPTAADTLVHRLTLLLMVEQHAHPKLVAQHTVISVYHTFNAKAACSWFTQQSIGNSLLLYAPSLQFSTTTHSVHDGIKQLLRFAQLSCHLRLYDLSSTAAHLQICGHLRPHQESQTLLHKVCCCKQQ